MRVISRGFVACVVIGVLGVAVDAGASTHGWAQASPSIAPSARQGPAMAYDPALETVVLFGGETDTARAKDTWTWDGTAWARLSPAASPPARNGAQLAYDADTQQLVLYGGANEHDGWLSDTWTFDGSTWTGYPDAARPGGRCGGAMAWDGATHQLILFGSRGNLTWSWDGSTWQRLRPAHHPNGGGCGSSMAFDDATNQLILFGGFGNGGAFHHATWNWDGTDWTRLAPAKSPSSRGDAMMAYSSALHGILLFGGTNFVDGTWVDDGDTWSWNGTTWARLRGRVRPPARSTAAMADDPAAGSTVLFGGFSRADGEVGDTWLWK